MVSNQIIVLSFLTGLFAGALFKFIEAPIPAPPNLAGIMGIVGIYVGFKLIEHFDLSFDLLGTLGF